MGLVDYSDSESSLCDSEAEEDGDAQPHQSKRVKVSSETSTTSSLPPLPARFRDLYSSTVRTSTQDDPSLHGGRKRVTPHVAGNWPGHVYLEWCPNPEQQALLEQAICEMQSTSPAEGSERQTIHSLLKNDLGVDLPLHVSLSRPLTLKTPQKDPFLDQLKSAITQTAVSAFATRPLDLLWHPNEDRTRWFLVLRLERPAADELQTLLKACNQIAGEFGQPFLYQTQSAMAATGSKRSRAITATAQAPPHSSFHISIAWSLQAQGSQSSDSGDWEELRVSKEVKTKVQAVQVDFEEVKVKIGQDVTSLALKKTRRSIFSSERDEGGGGHMAS
ncbi:unnamed protein product [Zymoseptoria tritici ST99CH_1A5]|uniref:U6 snRNA phosphodiesterase n=4 Tax=Zymoseptoria tritici TaxID=1047171 RepID=A0A1X7RTK6_ZYMT9|nr:unnamed protein product [Zymoseptoria tritici ST99CH_3D7]SMR52688.1 unnamed protein product [Zymoseptoria tritici ST99CH_1E4]SMR53926.1 unnamed protein product [Zymoseptoria tritici ST99CH_3D1]SMY24440.1 unnamed protein product [Zymoseptoria tritici ST99CH_1A5]